MLWILRCLKDRGGLHLDPLYLRLGQLLRIPESLLWLDYSPGATQKDYVVKHRMRLALTNLGFLGLVDTDDKGTWSLLPKGVDFLKPLDEEDAPMADRQWSRRTGINLTPAEEKLERELITDKRAEHKRRYSNRAEGGASAPSRPSSTKPDGWPTDVFSTKPQPPKDDTPG